MIRHGPACCEPEWPDRPLRYELADREPGRADAPRSASDGVRRQLAGQVLVDAADDERAVAGVLDRVDLAAAGGSG